MMTEDLLDKFFESLGGGDLLSALQQLLPAPDIAYDTLGDEKTVFHYVANYVDAAVFSSVVQFHRASGVLITMLEADVVLSLRYQKALKILKFENLLLQYVVLSDAAFLASKDSIIVNLYYFLRDECEGDIWDTKEVKAIFSQVPAFYRSSFEKKRKNAQEWQRFKQAKPEFWTFCSEKKSSPFPPYLTHPWHSFHYPLFINPQKFDIEEETIPLVFLDLFDGDFTQFLAMLSGKVALFVFESQAILWQLMRNSAVVDSLCEPCHLLYILNLYPNDQFAAQKMIEIRGAVFSPMMLVERTIIKEALPILMTVLQKCLEQSPLELKNDTEIGNWLYRIAKRIHFRIDEERLGISRAPALIECKQVEEWHDLHKGFPKKESDCGPKPKDYMGEKIKQLAKNRQPRKSSAKKRLKVAHVVGQIVDGGHAPSRLLENLLMLHDQERFELILISTEGLQSHPLEYPCSFYVSMPSIERAPQRISQFQKLGIKLFFIETNLTYEEIARQVSTTLAIHEVDIVVFHGPGVIQTMCTQMTDVPLRVMVEHGTQPSYPGFDVVMVSTTHALGIYRDFFSAIGTEAYALPFAVDARSTWEALPYSKQQLGFPENSFLMTTISNHLASRLSTEICFAIAKILQECPEAYYAPIGPVSVETERKMNQFFSSQGVADRVRFLQAQPKPSQYARSMELYLNEFPFGSCLGMLDAMAAGCPVVSMYDENGPQQARYGGSYFGIDRVVTSGKYEDYAALACHLIRDKALYHEWSEHAKQQYEKHSEVRTYTQNFETILETCFLKRLSNGLLLL